MTPNVTHPETRRTDPETPEREPTADLHPDVRAVMQATEALPVHDDGVPVIELPTETGTVRASIPADATEKEAAAIAVALTAHLSDQAEQETDTSPARADPWRLSNRVGPELGRRIRQPPETGQAWKMAGRVRARR